MGCIKVKHACGQFLCFSLLALVVLPMVVFALSALLTLPMWVLECADAVETFELAMGVEPGSGDASLPPNGRRLVLKRNKGDSGNSTATISPTDEVGFTFTTATGDAVTLTQMCSYFEWFLCSVRALGSNPRRIAS